MIEKLTQSIDESGELIQAFINHCEQIQFPTAVELAQRVLVQHLTQKNELEYEVQRLQR